MKWPQLSRSSGLYRILGCCVGGVFLSILLSKAPPIGNLKIMVVILFHCQWNEKLGVASESAGKFTVQSVICRKCLNFEQEWMTGIDIGSIYANKISIFGLDETQKCYRNRFFSAPLNNGT